MKNFVVSARKYRPAVFDHVVGQPHITTTLKNAIKDKHLAQAFLFCGPRGVGKTTCARILAKTINCQQVTTAIEPCNACASCTSFNNNSSLNVYELDAASNNSVDDIRALVEQVRYPPQAGQYKVYIIDEVHMLSNAAFNAFLKTLEEPPSYAIFILATTEKHKIIPTILSRCQIFDFHRIQPQDIVQQLKHIAEQEGIACEEEALHLISQKADGALRDALSIFDLITTFASGQAVTSQATREHLHILDDTYYFKLTDAFLQRNPAAALLLYDEILKAGFDGYHFITGLSEHFRNLMVCQDATSLQLLAAADSVKEQYQAQAAQAAPAFLHQALGITNQCNIHYRGSNNKRLHVELALIDIAYIQGAPQQTDSLKQPSTQLPSLAPPSSPTPKPISAPAKTKQPKQESKEKNAVNSPIPAPESKPRRALPATIKLPQIDQLKKSLSQPPATPTPPPPEHTTAQEPITQETVQQHWLAYAQQLKQAGKMSEYSLLNQEITLEGNTVVMKLVNAVQQDTLASLKEDLIAYLRQNLHAKELVLKGVVVQAEQHKKPYTAQEKFKYLVEKYPDLRTLQEKLVLEVQD